MTIVACLLAIALIATILLSQRHQAKQQDAWTVERGAWNTERTQLLERAATERAAERHQLLEYVAAQVRERASEHAQDAQRWAEERSELLARIQRPDFIPRAAPAGYVIPDREPDEIDMVGQVHLDPTWDPDEPVGILPDPD